MVSVEEWQLLSFFSTIPTPREPGEPWPYNDFLFEVVRGDVALSCAIDPAYMDVRLIVTVNGKKLYEIDAVDIEDIRYHTEHGRETLEFLLSERLTLWLSLEPEIQIREVLSFREQARSGG